jgi:NADPH2:quinone reductase
VRAITGGRGVDVACDSVGKDPSRARSRAWRCGDTLVNFGQSSGSVEPFEVARLAARSNSVTRPILFHYIGQRKDLERMAGSGFNAVVQGVVAVELGNIFRLSAAAAAHAELESRQASKALLLAS